MPGSFFSLPKGFLQHHWNLLRLRPGKPQRAEEFIFPGATFRKEGLVCSINSPYLSLPCGMTEVLYRVSSRTEHQLHAVVNYSSIDPLLDFSLWVHIPETIVSSDSHENSRLAEAACSPFYITLSVLQRGSQNATPQANIS